MAARPVRYRRHPAGNDHAPYQPVYQPFNSPLRETCKRIETLFSQLCDQFMIHRNVAYLNNLKIGVA
jgi:hypothetical protein